MVLFIWWGSYVGNQIHAQAVYAELFPLELSQWFDDDGDGKMEFMYTSNYLSGKFKIVEGKGVLYEEVSLQETGNSDMFPCNLNNDTEIDYYGWDSSDNPSWKLVVTSCKEDGDKLRFEVLAEDYHVQLSTCDYNSDGRIDLVLSDGRLAVQQIDGTFALRKLDVMSLDAYKGQLNDEWGRPSNYNGVILSNGIPSLRDGMFVGSNAYTGSLNSQITDIDFNNDGRIDILNNQSGQLLMNMGDGKYVAIALGGSIYFRDLNGDQKMDYVVYDRDRKVVTSVVEQPGGSIVRQELMRNLSLDEVIWCYDFDKDGDVDVLLPFSYMPGDVTYLVMMENDGHGNFTEHEYSFGKYKFEACVDVDNDGYYDIVARNKGNIEIVNTINGPRRDETCYDLNLDKDVWLLKGDSHLGFTLNETTPFLRLSDKKIEKPYSLAVADIDNDGVCEILVNDEYKMDRIYYLSGITPNKAPDKPAKPGFIYEPSSGYLKVNWNPGKDAESSSADLTYALRIGTAPGKGDVIYAHAQADGTRRNLSDGNMGHNLSKLFDASGWNKGKYYISVQAIDPMHKGSSWSEEVVFDKTVLSSGFTLSGERVVSDTLTLSLTDKPMEGIIYNWEMADARIIEVNADHSIYRIQFPTTGEKRIALQIEDAEGNISPLTEEVIYMFGNKLTYEEPTGNSWLQFFGFFDMNGDGVLEALTDQGVQVNDGKGNFSKMNGIFNLNLSFDGLASVVTDINKDGFADVATYSLGTVDLHMNLDGNKLKTQSMSNEIDMSGTRFFYDIDNDGFPDMFCSRGQYDEVCCLNSGDYVSFTPMEGEFYGGFRNGVVDFNRDGYWDVILRTINDDKVTINFNEGEGTYRTERLICPIGKDYTSISGVADMNNDGYPDLIIQKNNTTFLIALNNENKDFKAIKEIYLPQLNDYPEIIFSCVQDFDNNGYPDLLLSGLAEGWHCSIVYCGEDLSTDFCPIDVEFVSADMESYWGDVTCDNIPDLVQFTSLNLNHSIIPNTRPEAPLHVRGTQQTGHVLLEWDAAKDKETPYAQMRYNISVKKQGVTGEGAYIISPLNELKAEAAVSPSCHYPMATRMEIPLSVLPVGTYEVQVQSIDAWNAASEFSEPFVLQVVASPAFVLPSSVCKGTSAVITYKGTAGELIWDWDDGRLLHVDGDKYEVVWNEEGLKQLSVTVGGVAFSASLYVGPAVDATFTMPEFALVNSEIPVKLPDGDYAYSWEIRFNNEDFRPLTNEEDPYYVAPPIRIARNVATREAKVQFLEEGLFVLRLNTATPCGSVSSERTVHVSGSVQKQEIDLVTVDNMTGKNRISWTLPKDMPSYVTEINIYKEGSRYNDFYLLATVPVTQTEYIDMLSDPQISSACYRLTLVTSYGVETTPGTAHRGVHLMINKGLENTWNLMWSKYEGAMIESYRILRGTAPDHLVEIASVSGGVMSYTDRQPETDVTYYYALQFDTRCEEDGGGMKMKAANETDKEYAYSNTISTVDVTDAIHAEQLYIHYIEAEAILTETQPILHLSAEVYPLQSTYRGVNWSVESGAEIASISRNGVLTAKKNCNGTVIVRAMTIDGSNLYKEISVPVSGFKVMAQSITVSTEEGVTEISPSRLQLHLKAVVLPEETSDKSVIWTLIEGDELCSLTQNGVLTATTNQNGKAVVRAASQDNSAVYGELMIIFSGFPGSNIQALQTDFRIYPSVADEWVQIDGIPVSTGKTTVSVINMRGQVVYESETDIPEMTVFCGKYPKGVYIIRVANDKLILRRQFIRK